jgi:putative membrane protein
MMEYYEWILTFHVMAFMSWMAMLFYQPRLYVYHQEHADNSGFVEVVKIQEYKLITYIGMPAMWATIASGAWMIYLTFPYIFEGGYWMHAKLIVLVLLVAYTYSLEYYRKELSEGRCTKSGKFFRFYNEIPTILSIAIVIFVVVKPM